MKVGNLWIWLLGLSIVLLFNSCDRTEKTEVEENKFSEYVVSYPSGVISRASSLVFVFNKNVPEDVIASEKLLDELLSFEPSISGEAKWVNSFTLMFVPDTFLPSGQQFEGKLYLYKIFKELSKKYGILEFEFSTPPQDFTIIYEGVRSTPEMNRTIVQYAGRVVLRDFESIELVKKMLKFIYPTKNFPVAWEEVEKNRIFRFVIDSIPRQKDSSIIVVEWDGEPIRVDRKVRDTLVIPAIGSFKIVDAVVLTGEEQGIKIIFSDPLDPNQDFRGLVRLRATDKSEGQELKSLTFVPDGNVLYVYVPTGIEGTFILEVSSALRNAFGDKLEIEGKEVFEKEIRFETLKPQIEKVTDGFILPTGNGMVVYPISAINISKLKVTVLRVYSHNVLQLLQEMSMWQISHGEPNHWFMPRVADTVFHGTVELPNATLYKNQWKRYYLDLKQLVNIDPGAIYFLSISMDPEGSLYNCPEGISKSDDEEDYYWDYSNDPCEVSYYRYYKRRINAYLLATDLGVVAKRLNPDSVWVAVLSIGKAKPVENVKVEVYNYAQHKIAEGLTNGQGIAKIKADVRKASFIIVSKGKERNYLSLKNPLPVEMFDVGGNTVKGNLLAFIYGERGVWRPGDTIHLTAIIRDVRSSEPPEYPVRLELYDPRGKLKYELVQTKPVNGFYTFHIATSPEDLTGNWEARIIVGGAKFSKTLHIESIKPNRLMVEIQPKDKLVLPEKRITYVVKWIHGTPASGVSVEVEGRYVSVAHPFKRFRTHFFVDPARQQYKDKHLVHSGKTDQEGKGSFELKLNEKNLPGIIDYNLIFTMHEPGGGTSIEAKRIRVFPFKKYVGILTGEELWWGRTVQAGEENPISLVVMDHNGKLSSSKVKLEIYELKWRWWWEERNRGTGFSFREGRNAIKLLDTVITVNKPTEFKFKFPPEWGKYYVRATCLESGHTAGLLVYGEWYWHSLPEGETKTASLLMFSSNKDTYGVGDSIHLHIPTDDTALAIITVEQGNRIIATKQVMVYPPGRNISFLATKQMVPNAYFSVLLIRPHSKDATTPLRKYGIINVNVENPETRLQPIITVPTKIKPGQKLTIRVKEKEGKPMTFTLAIVDEGLLRLTGYTVPDPWKYFYGKQALTLKTYDNYDYVMGWFNIEKARLVKVGGDRGPMVGGKGDAFKVKDLVFFKGPVHISSGEEKSFTVKIPDWYFGKVRVMVVAGGKDAYGSAEKGVSVIQKFMVDVAVPRIVSPKEELLIPVNVFALEEGVKSVSVSLSVKGPASIDGPATKTVQFNTPGVATVYFPVKIKDREGSLKITVSGKGYGEQLTRTKEVVVKVKSPSISQVYEKKLEPGDQWVSQITPFPYGEDRGVFLDITAFKPIRLSQHLGWMLSYPHGCLEQITSKAFAVLYLDYLINLDERDKKKQNRVISKVLRKLADYQTVRGGFALWSGSPKVNPYLSVYAGHFMIEAKRRGYQPSQHVYDAWKRYESERAASWHLGEGNPDLQAYRLYVLALDGDFKLSSMNYLRGISHTLSPVGKWFLATAYWLSGNTQVAKELVTDINKIHSGEFSKISYGTRIRDIAMVSEAMIRSGYSAKELSAFIDTLATHLNKNRWIGTQTLAWTLKVLGLYAQNWLEQQNLDVSITYGGKPIALPTNKNTYVLRVSLDAEGGTKQLKVVNKGSMPVYAQVVLRGGPESFANVSAQQRGVTLKVHYESPERYVVDPSELTNGQNIYAVVEVMKTGNVRRGGNEYENMVLEFVVPSGWELIPERLMSEALGESGYVSDRAMYKDIRDDRVYIYFNMRYKDKMTFVIPVSVSYPGSFYMPPVRVEDMYHSPWIYANTISRWIQVKQK
ncbi:MAG: hypothetical protein GXO48_05835 [Chlorobi bacterium]|nr:hypothetical protein [Chlorobiota bacterium]